MKANTNLFGRLLMLLAAMSQLGGCYVYRLSPDAQAEIAKSRAIERTGDRRELCREVTTARHTSAETLYTAGQCAEEGLAGKASAAQFYRSAAECGSVPARERLLTVDGSRVKKVYAEGETSVLLHDSSPDECSFDREVTTVGWVVAPVAVPVYIAGAAAVVAVGLAACTVLLAAAILAGGH